MELEKYRRATRRNSRNLMSNSTLEKKTLQDQILHFLYNTCPGRMILRPLIHPAFSRAGGLLLETRLSALAVGPFVKANQIDLAGCEKKRFRSFNDFFTRKLVSEARPVLQDADAVISPCDARLSVYPIAADGHFWIKNTSYTLERLLNNSALAEKYMGGYLWLYRLSVDDYHRYIYPSNGIKSHNVRIPGVFHTVNPIANDIYPIYKENTREYCLIKNTEAGTILQMEVGAMLVGKIENHHSSSKKVSRGEEKGNFAFGGSTIIVLTQPGAAFPEEEILENTNAHVETRVRLGQQVGHVEAE